VMILMWNVGTAVILVSLAAIFGRRLFSWVGPGSALNRG
jgi:hypothetical protein